MIDAIAQNVIDPRDPKRDRYSIDELIRERVFAMAMGYSAQDGLDRLAHVPAFRAAVWNRSGDELINQRLASQPTQSRLIDILTSSTANLKVVRNGLADTIHRHVLASGGRRVEFNWCHPTFARGYPTFARGFVGLGGMHCLVNREAVKARSPG